jgi:hypothetical protein
MVDWLNNKTWQRLLGLESVDDRASLTGSLAHNRLTVVKLHADLST